MEERVKRLTGFLLSSDGKSRMAELIGLLANDRKLGAELRAQALATLILQVIG